jgi:hypothetical protein
VVAQILEGGGTLTGWSHSRNIHLTPARQIRALSKSRSSHAATTCAEAKNFEFGDCSFLITRIPYRCVERREQRVTRRECRMLRREAIFER